MNSEQVVEQFLAEEEQKKKGYAEFMQRRVDSNSFVINEYEMENNSQSKSASRPEVSHVSSIELSDLNQSFIRRNRPFFRQPSGQTKKSGRSTQAKNHQDSSSSRLHISSVSSIDIYEMRS